ncbi:MAG: enoyl-CoA hydratase/isomerase family protein [Bdellovibrio sp.]|nr:enoyl-CoA hydratase/isomerase family protein [Bdellovibrio sp.]
MTADSSTTRHLIQEMLDPGICVLKISRPEALNALNTDVLIELKDALLKIANTPEIRVLIFTGNGEKAFIAGADITEMKGKTVEEGVQFAQLGHEVTKLLELMPKPTIAAVNGYALGGGTELALACDFIYASDKAVFGQPEVGLGVIPGFGGTLRLSKFVGLPRAKELIFTGRRVKAEEAFQIGLVCQVFESNQLMPRVIEIAQTISKHSATAVAKAKHLLNEFAETSGLNVKLDAEAHAFGRLFETHDQREGMSAFVEKRKPVFHGLS